MTLYMLIFVLGVSSTLLYMEVFWQLCYFAIISCLLTLFQTSPGLQYRSFENTAEKGEITRREQFLLFPQCFLPFWKTFCHFQQIENCRLPTLSVWKSLKLVIWERVNLCDASTRAVSVYITVCYMITLRPLPSWRDLLWKSPVVLKYQPMWDRGTSICL